MRNTEDSTSAACRSQAETTAPPAPRLSSYTRRMRERIRLVAYAEHDLDRPFGEVYAMVRRRWWVSGKGEDFRHELEALWREWDRKERGYIAREEARRQERINRELHELAETESGEEAPTDA